MGSFSVWVGGGLVVEGREGRGMTGYMVEKMRGLGGAWWRELRRTRGSGIGRSDLYVEDRGGRLLGSFDVCRLPGRWFSL